MYNLWPCLTGLGFFIWDNYFGPYQFRSQSLRSPWPAVGKRELWEQPFWNNKGNNRICPSGLRQSSSMAHACNGCSQSLSIPAAGQKDRGLWGREMGPYRNYKDSFSIPFYKLFIECSWRVIFKNYLFILLIYCLWLQSSFFRSSYHVF